MNSENVRTSRGLDLKLFIFVFILTVGRPIVASAGYVLLPHRFHVGHVSGRGTKTEFEVECGTLKCEIIETINGHWFAKIKVSSRAVRANIEIANAHSDLLFLGIERLMIQSAVFTQHAPHFFLDKNIKKATTCGDQDGGIGIKTCIASFCGDPVRTVCGENREVAVARAKSIYDFRKPISENALHASAQEFGIEHPEQFGEEALAELEQFNYHLWKQVSRDYKTRLVLMVAERLAGGFSSLAAQFVDVKEQLLQVIPDELNGEPKLAEKAQGVVTQTVLGDDAKFLRKQYGKKLLKDFNKNCGFIGFEDNAYQDYFGSTPAIVICPGSLIASLAQKDQTGGSADATGLIMTMAHEISHHFDSDNGPFKTVYKNFLICMESSYPDELRKPFITYRNEIIADYWGGAVLSRFIEKYAQTSFSFVSHNLEDLCEDEGKNGGKDERNDDGVHPSGPYRITHLARDHHALDNFLGCKGSKEPRCHL